MTVIVKEQDRVCGLSVYGCFKSVSTVSNVHAEECGKLRTTFLNLDYPANLINSSNQMNHILKNGLLLMKWVTFVKKGPIWRNG